MSYCLTRNRIYMNKLLQLQQSRLKKSQDADVFEITDFTTASDWERFIARFEEILHEWKLVTQPPLPLANKNEYTTGIWDEKVEEITFSDFNFTVTHHYLKSCRDLQEKAETERTEESEEEDESDAPPTVYLDLMSMENDFPSRAHCLCRWYGIRDFVVVAPASNNDAITSESKIKLLLSSFTIALANTGCPVPVFIQVSQRWRRMFQGACVFPGSRVDFEMAHLKKLPSQYNHLTGLLDVFKSKLGCSITSLPPVSVSVRFTYVLQEWVHSSWPQAFPDFSSPTGGEVGCSDFGSLPFGACEDPVSELHLSCTWPSLSEEMIVENQVYSDLDPLQAPQWSVRIQMTEDPQCLLDDYITQFIQLCHRKETTDELLGSLMEDDDAEGGADISQALQRLTEPTLSYNIPSLTSVVSHASTKLKIKPDEAPISEELLNQILQFLFPDAKPEEDEAEGVDIDDRSTPETSDSKSDSVIKDLCKQLKSASVDSLTYKMAVSLCIINHNLGGLRAVAHLWQEFVLEMRYRWENNYLIPGVECGSPNMGSCILHQKLQMLNCCIERKFAREKQAVPFADDSPRFDTDTANSSPREQNSLQNNTTNSAFSMEGAVGKSGTSPAVDSSSDEEFYECADEAKSDPVTMETEETSDLDISLESANSESSFSEPVIINFKPDGRLTRCGDLMLINTGEPMFIPITQEPAPMTEDMLEEHAEVLARLGSSIEGTHLRARMQSACLFSDMESFKAANPNCSLDDFVRWYSPRDWVEEDSDGESNVVRGHLSSRMQIPGNMWVEVWQGAKPVPARRQKRLFDDTKEAEKVLHFLSSMKPASVVLHLMPMLIHAAIVQIFQNEDQDVPKLKLLVEQLTSKAARTTRCPIQDVRKYEDLLKLVRLAETVIARAKSLKSKFTEDLLETRGAEEELHMFVSSLLQQPEVSVRGGPCGPAGSIIHKLFTASQKASCMLSEDEDEKEDLHASVSSIASAGSASDFPSPTGREYILRTVVPRPAPYSRPLPQRMYCVLLEDDFRLAGAFSADTTFQ